MNVDQHLKVASWHIEQARLHATSKHSCGCPANPHDQKAIDAVEAAMKSGAAIKEDKEDKCDIARTSATFGLGKH